MPSMRVNCSIRGRRYNVFCWSPDDQSMRKIVGLQPTSARVGDSSRCLKVGRGALENTTIVPMVLQIPVSPTAGRTQGTGSDVGPSIEAAGRIGFREPSSSDREPAVEDRCRRLSPANNRLPLQMCTGEQRHASSESNGLSSCISIDLDGASPVSHRISSFARSSGLLSYFPPPQNASSRSSLCSDSETSSDPDSFFAFEALPRAYRDAEAHNVKIRTDTQRKMTLNILTGEERPEPNTDFGEYPKEWQIAFRRFAECERQRSEAAERMKRLVSRKLSEAEPLEPANGGHFLRQQLLCHFQGKYQRLFDFWTREQQVLLLVVEPTKSADALRVSKVRNLNACSEEEYIDEMKKVAQRKWIDIIWVLDRDEDFPIRIPWLNVEDMSTINVRCGEAEGVQRY